LAGAGLSKTALAREGKTPRICATFKELEPILNRLRIQLKEVFPEKL